MSKYSSQLRDPRWQKRRLEILELHEFMCDQCLSKDRELHVHHTIYHKGKMPWEYDEKYFCVLCVNCHDKYHELKTMFDENICSSIDSGFAPVDLMNLLRGSFAAMTGIETIKREDGIHAHSAYVSYAIGNDAIKQIRDLGVKL